MTHSPQRAIMYIDAPYCPSFHDYLAVVIREYQFTVEVEMLSGPCEGRRTSFGKDFVKEWLRYGEKIYIFDRILR